MVSIRKLPSGKHQATVRLPSGKRITRTDRLRKVVADWGRAEEERIARGEWRDQNTMRITYDVWRDQFMAARVVEPATARRDRGSIVNHLDPQWSGWRLSAITRIEVQGWVKAMDGRGVGPHAIRAGYNLFSAMMKAAVDEGLIPSTPCRRVTLPVTAAKLPEWFTPAQLDAILEHLPSRHAAGAQLMAWCGLRWGECAGLRVQDVKFLRRRASVVGVNTQKGAWKEYPKTSASRREVSVPPHVLELLAPLAAGKAPEDLLFRTTARERPWAGTEWREVWTKAIVAAQRANPGLGVPRYAPHALRHTAASWLVQDGVPLYDVQALLGHESFQMTQRYAHLQPDSHGAVEAAWERMRKRRDAPGAHGVAGVEPTGS